MEPLRVLLVDDHVLFRKGIASLLAAKQGITVVGEAGDGVEAVTMVRETSPNIILMDINMPRQGGLETIKIIKEEMPELDVVVLTVSEDDEDLFEAIKSGAKGYLLKNLEPQQLFDMLEGIRQGEAPISGSMAAKILQEFKQPNHTSPNQADTPDELTPREIDVLEEVVKGASNKEISAALHITENTVKIHLRNILDKLQVRNRIQAAVHAVREGLVDEYVPEE
jgi:DNA-binding NarL/FixJ family response regulator